MVDWIDKVGLPEVVFFTEEQLLKHDLSNLDSFKFLPLPKERFAGTCTYPKRLKPRSRTFVHGYRIRCSLRVEAPYPHREEIVTGTETVSGNEWRYLTAKLDLEDLEEMAVFLAGHEAFHFLRHSRQITGRNTEPQANLHALRWLQEWKCRT
ncbi:MAG: hypothetical protein GY937_22785 [bacterium]|nr:hypothetical protein [bacterium]